MGQVSMKPSAGDGLLTIGGASLATLAIIGLRTHPLWLAGLLLGLLACFLWRWHQRRHLAGLLVGATLGNLTEVGCDLKGIWIHAAPDLWNAVPLYILICYPILGLSLPPLVDAVLRRSRPRGEAGAAAGQWALGLWAAHLLMSLRHGTNNQAELLASSACLVLTLWRFHSAHDLGFGVIGALLALVWELPCTATGVWRFAEPELAGLIPYWLPLAYAVFFITMGRAGAALAERSGRPSQ
jgi:hypothetical protein